MKKEGNVFVIKIPETKTNVIRSFTVEGKYAEFIRKYAMLRPLGVEHTRFFLNYQKGKCTSQPIGRNKFLGVPKIIAEFLGLPEVNTFSGHSFRRTSATLLANAGADMTTLKRHGGWRSTSVVEGYIENSLANKRKIGGLISNELSSVTSTVTSTQRIINVMSDSTICSSSDVNNEIVNEISTSTSIATLDDTSPLPKKAKNCDGVEFNITNSTVNIHYH